MSGFVPVFLFFRDQPKPIPPAISAKSAPRKHPWDNESHPAHESKPARLLPQKRYCTAPVMISRCDSAIITAEKILAAGKEWPVRFFQQRVNHCHRDGARYRPSGTASAAMKPPAPTDSAKIAHPSPPEGKKQQRVNCNKAQSMPDSPRQRGDSWGWRPQRRYELS